jgi:hypothetical protein
VPGAMVGEQTAMASSRQIRGRGARGGPRERAWSGGIGRAARGVEDRTTGGRCRGGRGRGGRPRGESRKAASREGGWWTGRGGLR